MIIFHQKMANSGSVKFSEFFGKDLPTTGQKLALLSGSIVLMTMLYIS